MLLLEAIERNALWMAINIEALVAQEAHERHPEMLRGFDGQT
jgi:hypothetical protein